MIPKPQSSRGNGGGLTPSDRPTIVQRGFPRGTADEAFGYWWRGTRTGVGLEVEAEGELQNDLAGSGERRARSGGRLGGGSCGRYVRARSARADNCAGENPL